MPRRPNPVQKIVEAKAVKLNKAVETVVATLGGISTDVAGALVILEGSANVLLGATGTEVVLRIRRGTTTGGTEVAKATFNALTAAKSYGLSIQSQDSQEGEIASGSYVITAENVGATTEGEAVQASLTATF
jgi:hypothetical protein